MDKRVIKVVELMRGNPHFELTLEALAQAVNLSPSRLHQIFKNETGMSPAKYLKNLRLAQAKKLLETTFLSVKEIRGRVGIRDESHFVRDFKNAYGDTPSQYRARHLAALAHSEGTADSYGSTDAGEFAGSARDAADARGDSIQTESTDEGPPVSLLPLPAFG
ncbi:MAG TPA: helix-turn-helix transcriptional regulator [Pyrinomonadaceae bacterium]|nr:helix-turn-helix transcriptional regulator [Pyrinomonadaceae bacterium]